MSQSIAINRHNGLSFIAILKICLQKCIGIQFEDMNTEFENLKPKKNYSYDTRKS